MRKRHFLFAMAFLGVLLAGICNDAADVMAQVEGGAGLTVQLNYVVKDGFPRKGKVTAGTLNVRKGAGTGNGIVAVVSYGQEVELQDVVKLSSGEYWYKISFYQDGKKKTGYVNSRYIEEGERIVTGTPTPVPMFTENHGNEDMVAAIRKVQSDSTEEERKKLVSYAEAFWVTGTETVYLLDSYGKRVLKVSGKEYEYISIPDSVLASDMICQDGELYIYDESEQEFEIYNESGEFLFAAGISLENDYVKGLLEEEGEVVMVTYNGVILCPDREKGELTATEARVEDSFRDIPDDGAVWDFSEYMETDTLGNSYFINTCFIKNSSVLAGEISIEMQDAEGISVGNYALPVLEYDYLPKRYIQIEEDGTAYLFIPKEEVFEVRKIIITGQQNSVLDEIKKEAAALEKKYAETADNTKKRKVNLDRKAILDRVDGMLAYTWTLRKANTARISAGTILPRYITAIVEEKKDEKNWSVEMTGIPYCWGGFASQYNTSLENRLDYLLDKKNYMAGNIYGTGYYVKGTAGLDCSGFAGTAYGIKEKINTHMLLGIGKKLDDTETLQSMDMLVAPGSHVLMFYDVLDEGNFLAAEATTRDGKAVLHPKSWNELLVQGKYQMRSPYK